jgi:selenocysteine lyase/cysteine desulfurase
VAGFCEVKPERVILTAGATDACDTVLTTRKGPPRRIIHSDLAHECIRRSVHCAAEYLSALCGARVAPAQIEISDLFSLAPPAFATTLAQRLKRIVRAERGILVIEHVTSEDGILLPILEISEHVRHVLPEIDIVVDGAQAAGLWRPPSGLNRAYIGCFHKYIDGPVGTGFCVLPTDFASRTLHRLRATQSWSKPSTSEHLPTADVLKWNACRQAVAALDMRGSCHDRLAAVLRARQELLESAPNELIAHLAGVRPEYLSHILSFRASDSNKGPSLWQRLRDCGFSTKRLDDGVRVTLHETLPPQLLRAFADVLCEFSVTPLDCSGSDSRESKSDKVPRLSVYS